MNPNDMSRNLMLGLDALHFDNTHAMRVQTCNPDVHSERKHNNISHLRAAEARQSQFPYATKNLCGQTGQTGQTPHIVYGNLTKMKAYNQ